jgi:DNA-directed RNA polymerase specialized sigma24 family protein
LTEAKIKRYKAWCRWLESKHSRHFEEMVGEFSHLARRVTGKKWGHLSSSDFDELMGHAFFGTFEFFNKLDVNRLKDYDHLETTFCWYINKKLLSAFRGSQMRSFSSKLKAVQPLSLNQRLIEDGEEEWVDMLQAKVDPFAEVEFWETYGPLFDNLSPEQRAAVYFHNVAGFEMKEIGCGRHSNVYGLTRMRKDLEGRPARRPNKRKERAALSLNYDTPPLRIKGHKVVTQSSDGTECSCSWHSGKMSILRGRKAWQEHKHEVWLAIRQAA